MTINFLPLFLSLIPMFGWGTMDFLGAKVSRKMGAIFGLFIFQFIGLLMLLPFVPFVPLKITTALVFVFLLGIFNMGAWLGFMYGARIGDISIVGPIGQAGYAIASFLGIILLKESLNLIKIISMIVVFAGVTLLSTDWRALKKIKVAKLYKGVIPAIIAAVDTGITFVLLAPFSRLVGWFYTSFLFRAAIALSSFCLLLFKRENIRQKMINIPYPLILGMALVDIAGFTTYNYAVTRYEVSYVMVIVSGSSLVTIILAYFFLHEKLRLLQKIGALLVVLGIIGLQLA